MTDQTTGLKVQFGSGPTAYSDWLNFDCSPSLRIQKVPILGAISKWKMGTVFDAAVLYGDSRTGLPLADNSVGFLYCSHILEHLALDDFRLALQDCYRLLAPGAVFRAVMPDLAALVQEYLKDESADACSRFMENTYMAHRSRPKGLAGLARTVWGNSHHMWLWDYKGAEAEFRAAGFVEIRRAYFQDSEFPEFRGIEVLDRWEGQLGLECRKQGSSAF